MERTQTKTDQSKLKTKGHPGGKRRYPAGIFPLYDKTYGRLANDSVILNDARRAQDMRNSAALYGVSECRSTLIELEGAPNLDGYYKKDKTAFKALIPSAKERLQDAHADFQRWQKEQIRAGKTLTPPKEWPDTFLVERLKAEALLDVRRAEKAKAEARIHKLTKEQREKEKQAKKIFRFGLTGNSADNQNISYTEDDVPFIDDERSPYDGMSLFHYKEMVKDWKKENNITEQDLRKRMKDFREKMIQAGKKDEIPAMLTGDKFKQMMQNKSKWLENPERHDWPEWDKWPENPGWPEHVKPINEIETEVDS